MKKTLLNITAFIMAASLFVPGAAAKKKPYRRAPKVFVEKGEQPPKGLSGRHIALWQSHGMYFEQKTGEWTWQRPCLFQTVEDLYTQSYVVPFLVPMLENAGASTYLPRERDWHDVEIIIDNDPSEHCSARVHGDVATTGRWHRLDKGFADPKKEYCGEDNPFAMGSSLRASTVTRQNSAACAEWNADIPERGEYAVYVAYSSFAKSAPDARYTVHTLGGDTVVKVDQRMGGGTWIYIGTYEFGAGRQTVVSLSNLSARSGAFVSADAVRLGGGMGCIARGLEPEDSIAAHPGALRKANVSGKPRFAEGARYYLQWSGFPAKVWSQNDGMHDYRDDLMSRGMWVQHLSGSSKVNPRAKDGLGIPVDLSLAFHTDAGVRADDSIVGTLGIYTLLCNNSDRLPSGESRTLCGTLTDSVQTQIVRDLRAQWDPQWTRRDLWNRSYSESRTTGCPAMLLELLSHQNFEDMKYGADPAFRFTVARAVYKAILRWMSARFGGEAVVQPLPVRDFAAILSQGRDSVHLSWKATVDTLEKSAVPTYFKIYTRIDGGGWDSGRRVGSCRASVPIKPGHIYSWKIVSGNDGGVSFPSEILSAGVPDDKQSPIVQIINAFTRISGPDWFDTPTYAGFCNRDDSGVPYIRDWSFIGEQYEFRRGLREESSDCPGFGASYSDYAFRVIGGNTFDYPYIHGRAIMDNGYAFCSVSAGAFESSFGTAAQGCTALDVICGKEKVVRTGNRSRPRGGVFTPGLVTALRYAAASGCSILLSGSYIATDTTVDAEFTSDMLGYTPARGHGSLEGRVAICAKGAAFNAEFPTKPCGESYCVESPDVIRPSSERSEVVARFTDTSLPCGVFAEFSLHRSAAFSFPLEITGEKQLCEIFKLVLNHFSNGHQTHN